LKETAMRPLIAILVIILLGAAAYASETINYQYDARGRLIQVNHSGSVNNNVVTNYTYDKADNRTLKNTTGAP
jgi:YD repeat-containing protein